METVTNPADGATTASKRHYDTMAESIAKMKLAFGNATLPEIFTALVVAGYTAEKITGFNTKLSELEALLQSQIKEYADQSEEQDKFDAKRAAINKIFNQHRGLTRILFKNDTLARVSLQLDSENPVAYASWVQLVNNFYSQLAANPALQTKASAVGITPAAIATQQQEMSEVQARKESLRKETSEAQAATEARDTAFDELYSEYVTYIKYAKILLPESQALEAIGVKVKAK